MRRLIINADDFGLTGGVCQGIRFAFSCGAISSTTAMMNLPGIAAELEVVKRDAPSLPVGVHLCLTLGKPLTPPERIPSLVDGEGRFVNRDIFLSRLESVRLEEAGLEFRAQIEALSACGIRPDHLDSHHFISYVSPGLLESMLSLAEEYRLAVRPPAASDGTVAELFPGLPQSAADFLSGPAWDAVRRSPVPTADRLYLTFYNKTATAKNLQRILGDLPDGISEIMCHPGMADGELRNISDYAEERGYELTLLTESGLPEMLTSQGIHLFSYGRPDA
jgi:predicted glycoside hydrolase/deacetylase ChbG (UPF0249 family)